MVGCGARDFDASLLFHAAALVLKNVLDDARPPHEIATPSPLSISGHVTAQDGPHGDDAVCHPHPRRQPANVLTKVFCSRAASSTCPAEQLIEAT
jgi:hypothetical protein